MCLKVFERSSGILAITIRAKIGWTNGRMTAASAASAKWQWRHPVTGCGTAKDGPVSGPRLV
eukprot:7656198-Heterocapsa_arctica.AAC.1